MVGVVDAANVSIAVDAGGVGVVVVNSVDGCGVGVDIDATGVRVVAVGAGGA